MRPTPTASYPRLKDRPRRRHSISTPGGETWRRRSRCCASIPYPKPRQIVQPEYRDQKREPHRIHAVEEEAFHRRQIEREQPYLQQQCRQRSAIAIAIRDMEIAQRPEHQRHNQQCQSGQAHRQGGVEIGRYGCARRTPPTPCLAADSGSNCRPRTPKSRSRSSAGIAATRWRRSRCRRAR